MGTSRTTDETLIRELYAEHAGVLLAYARNLLGGDWARAEDVVQETLLRAWRHPEVFVRAQREGTSLRSWLITVVRNVVIDLERARRVRPSELPPEERPSASRDEDAAFQRVLTAYELADALSALSVDHQAVIKALYFGDCSVVEAAAQLHIPEGTVKSRAFYGLRALRAACQERGVTL